MNIFKISLLIFILFFVSTNLALQKDNSDCLDCHTDKSTTKLINGKDVPLFVDEEHFKNSVHGDLDCIDCHEDFDAEEIPHKAGNNIAEVDCGNCHDSEDVGEGIHTKKLKCYDCHTKHNIQPAASLIKAGEKFCLSCHKSHFVQGYLKSIHYKSRQLGKKAPTCITCHGENVHEINKTKFSQQKLDSICAQCHKNVVSQYINSLHGKALAQGKYLAPNCITCHGAHKILAHKNNNSVTYKMNIPALCGRCHKDGTKVSELKGISQTHILKNYSQSIHGKGLFERGLIVAAACTDCHTAHSVLPHTDPSSTINRKNIAHTCEQCHAGIEKVHKKVINGKLWESAPNKVPACIDCHQPHDIRQVIYEAKYTDNYCMNCHKSKELFKNVNGKKISLFVDYARHKKSVHKDNSCIKCHTNISISNNPVCKNSGTVDCSSCHAEVVSNYTRSIHGELHAKGNVNAPYCTDCHGKHYIKSKKESDSPTARQNIPKLCSMCHHEGKKAAVKYKGIEHNIIKNYEMSIHGQGLLKSGLVVSATCTDCHTSHMELPVSDSLSSVNRTNLPNTCSKCHLGIYEVFNKSVHSYKVTKTEKKLPDCYDCHQSHTIERVDRNDFRRSIVSQCGQCHKDVTETYFETFHGKVTKLGSAKTAKCSDCHGSHNILPPDDPRSTLSYQNIVSTCKKCHPNSNREFVGYLTHATHHNKNKYPYLYYTYLFMTILLIGTFSFFGIHTLLWLPRALAERKKEKNIDEENEINNKGKEEGENE